MENRGTIFQNGPDNCTGKVYNVFRTDFFALKSDNEVKTFVSFFDDFVDVVSPFKVTRDGEA